MTKCVDSLSIGMVVDPQGVTFRREGLAHGMVLDYAAFEKILRCPRPDKYDYVRGVKDDLHNCITAHQINKPFHIEDFADGIFINFAQFRVRMKF